MSPRDIQRYTWTVWELHGSYFAAEWINLYLAREYGTPETFN